MYLLKILMKALPLKKTKQNKQTLSPEPEVEMLLMPSF